MSDRAAHFDSPGKSGPARRISMELVADGARVTGLSMSGSRLVMTIEAELSASRMTTADEQRDEFVPPEPAAAPPAPAAKFSEPSSAAGAADIEPATDGTRPEPPGAELKPVAGVGAKYVEPAREDTDGDRSESQTEDAEPVAFGPDIPEHNPISAEPDRECGEEPVRPAPSEAAEPEIEAIPTPAMDQVAHDVFADGNAFDGERAAPSLISGRRDGAEPVETAEGDEPYGFPGLTPSGMILPGSPDGNEPAIPKPSAYAWGEAKSLSFASAMDAADKEKDMIKPRSDDPVKSKGRIISFDPATHNEPAGLPQPGHDACSDASESPLRETAPPASTPPEVHPETPAINLPRPPAHGDMTHPEECNTIGGDRHGEPQPAMSFGFENPEPPEQAEPKASSRAPDQPATKPESADSRTGNTTVLIRYTCPRCKTQGMQAVDKVGTVVNCSNCGKAMRLVMKK